MATGISTVTQITNAMETFVAEVQYVMDEDGVVENLIDHRQLPKGKGLVWKEPYFSVLTAADGVDGTIFDDPTQVSDNGWTLSPTEKIVQVLWSNKLVLAMKENFPKIAAQMESNALKFRQDYDLVTIFDSFGGSMGSGTSPATTDVISSALRHVKTGIPYGSGVARMGARASGDKSNGPWSVVLHDFHGHDLFGQWTATAGTGQMTGAVRANYPRAADASEYALRWLEENGVAIPGLPNARLYYDQNIPITTGPTSAKGAVFSRDAIVMLSYQEVQEYHVPTQDGRNQLQTMWVDYAVGKRVDTHGIELWLDATSPAA